MPLLRRAFTVLPLALLALAPLPHARSADQESPEAKRERLIARYLETGRVAEALIEAEGGVKAFPESGVIRRRLAQAQLCEALRLGRQLDQATQDVEVEHQLASLVSDWRNPERAARRRLIDPDQEQRYGPEHRRQQARRWAQAVLNEANNGRVADFHSRVKAEIGAVRPLRQRQAHLLAQCLSSLKEAQARHDDSVERELTDLWASVTLLLQARERQHADRMIQGPPGLALPDQEQVLSLLREWRAGEPTAESAAPSVQDVLRSAAKVAGRHPEDPYALAGAGDVLSIAAAAANLPDPIHEYACALRDHRFLNGAARYDHRRSSKSLDEAHAAYEAAVDLNKPDPDAVRTPGSLALRLYRQALARDPSFHLPYLRTVLYHLQLGFDRAEADRLLDEALRREPRNGAPVLERAVTAYAVDERLPEGMERVREASRYHEFRRSTFAAIPATLRPAFKFQRTLLELQRQRWPKVDGVFTTLEDVQRSIDAPATQTEFRLLRLRAAELLLQAPDYQDQAAGIEAKARVLYELLKLPEGLAPEQRLEYERELRAHQQLFAAYPKVLAMLRLGPDGMIYGGTPNLDPSASSVGKPQAFLNAESNVLFGLP